MKVTHPDRHDRVPPLNINVVIEGYMTSCRTSQQLPQYLEGNYMHNSKKSKGNIHPKKKLGTAILRIKVMRENLFTNHGPMPS
jgi:hypothetical protein